MEKHINIIYRYTKDKILIDNKNRIYIKQCYDYWLPKELYYKITI